ncbi:putative iron-regulated protein [Pedobacter sp. UYP30]|uniref:ChaN family lipoprotein n=1 Tax=Pedobacter sp. UYP30 TaxID=1756400 RepID=UPI00339B984F
MKIILFLFTVFTHNLLFAQTADSLYKIYDVKQQKEISLDDLVANADKANVVFFGEDHNDSVCHVVEFLIIKKLSGIYPAHIAISMEMFHTDLQPVLNEYLDGLISERNFLKEGNPWPNYTDYKPIIEYAKRHKLPIIAANVATRYSNAVTINGLSVLKKFPKSSRLFLPPLPIDTALGLYYTKFNQVSGGHGMGDMKIYQTQNLWDASMAWSIASYLRKHPSTKILQINGRFHSDEKLGAVAKLKEYRRTVKTLTISSFSGADFNHPKWKNYANLADYIVLTNPNIPRTY